MHVLKIQACGWCKKDILRIYILFLCRTSNPLRPCPQWTSRSLGIGPSYLFGIRFLQFRNCSLNPPSVLIRCIFSLVMQALFPVFFKCMLCSSWEDILYSDEGEVLTISGARKTTITSCKENKTLSLKRKALLVI